MRNKEKAFSSFFFFLSFCKQMKQKSETKMEKLFLYYQCLFRGREEKNGEKVMGLFG